MRKLTALTIVIAVLVLAVFPCYGEGIYVLSETGDMVKILEDTNITSHVGGNVISVLGDISIDGRVDGHVVAVFGEVTVNGKVNGQVLTIFGKTYLKEKAAIMGNVITIGSVSKSPSAVVRGKEVRMLGESMDLDLGALIYLRLVILVLFTFAAMVTGIMAILISKPAYAEMAGNIDKDVGRKLLLGILSFLGAGALLLLLLVTLIAPVLYIFVLILSTVTASMFFGRLILKTFSQQNSVLMEFFTGLISITLVKLLIIFLVPEREMLLGFGLLAVLNAFVYSMGMGIHIEHHYLKLNSKNS